MGYGNSGSWSDGGSWSSKSHKSPNSWKNVTGSTSSEHRKTASCAKVVARRSSQQDQTCQLAQVLEEARRNYALPAPGYPLPADRESFRHSTKMIDKAGQGMRNIEKKIAEMAATGRAGP